MLPFTQRFIPRSLEPFTEFKVSSGYFTDSVRAERDVALRVLTSKLWDRKTTTVNNKDGHVRLFPGNHTS